MEYNEEQRIVQSEFFDDKGGGLFNQKAYNFVLREEFRKDNLFNDIANDAINYFKMNKIGWWRGKDDLPTNHMLSSQVSCVNHLFWLQDNENAATEVLKGIDPEFKAIPFPKNANSDKENYVEFEYDGFDLTNNNGKNIIGERRTSRGATSTSVDAAMIAQKGNRKILVLIEWKYIEKYSGKAIDKETGTYNNQKSIYKNLLTMNESPINMSLLIENDKCKCDKKYDKEYVKFSIEPFYQLMRQTLLGWQLVGRESIIADDYIHIHVIPSGNKQLLNGKTSPNITNGLNICDGWKTYLKNPNKYKHIDPKDLIETSANKYNSRLSKYLSDRYWK